MNIFKNIFREPDRNDNGGETPDFIAFLNGSMEALQLQTATHQNIWNIDRAQRWNFTMDSGELVFTFSDKIVCTPAQIIGTLDNQAAVWMWAWANPSIPNPLAKDALQVREYGEQNHIRRLSIPKWPANEKDGWLMTALAGRLCGSNGAYCGPSGTTSIFFTFGEIQIKPQ